MGTFLLCLLVLFVGYLIGVFGSILHIQKTFNENKILVLPTGDYRLTKVK